jgi:hypothetical protein
MTCGLRALGLSLAVVAIGCTLGRNAANSAKTPARTTAAGSAADRPAALVSVPVATWVWDAATVLEPERRRALLSFAAAKGVRTLFVHASKTYLDDAGFDSLAGLVAAAQAAGLSIVLTGGDPAWSAAQGHSEALAFLARVAELEARLAARGLAHSRRVLFDVEPYLLPGWKAEPEQATAEYAALLQALHEAARTAGLEIWHTIPFWFATTPARERRLDRVTLELSDGVVVMAYRDRATDVVAAAEPTLAAAAELEKPVIVAVETQCVEPGYVTFCGKPPQALGDALREVRSRFAGAPAFAGLAVHHLASWQKLDGKS